MKRFPGWFNSLVLACGLAALLASCGQNEPELASAALAGKIRNWQGGSAALNAHVYDENGQQVLTTGSINDEGGFSLVLPNPPRPDLLEELAPATDICDGVSISVSGARILFLSDLEALRGGEPLGHVFQASTGTFGYGPPARGTVFAARLYSDRAFSVRGSCVESFTQMTITFDVDLKEGWNQVYAEVTEASDSDLAITLGSGRLPASVDWYIAHAPEPGPQIAFFGAEPVSAGGLAVTFTWEVYSPSDNVLTCHLDPGDGSPGYELDGCEGEGSIEHTYNAAGEYIAELWVIDEEGYDAEAREWLLVSLE